MSSNEYQRIYQLARYHRRRKEAIAYLGGQCSFCYITTNLEIDHKDWRTKKIPLSKLWSISKLRFYEELGKCQVLCHECHKEKNSKDLSQIMKGEKAKTLGRLGGLGNKGKEKSPTHRHNLSMSLRKRD